MLLFHILTHEEYTHYMNVRFEMGIDWHDTPVIKIFFYFILFFFYFLIFVFELQAQYQPSHIKTEI